MSSFLTNGVVSSLLTEVNSLIAIGGDWNEEGLIRGLDRKGFTPSLCGSELIANSCDSGAKNIKFVVDETSQIRTIKLIDDGAGMIISELSNMFSMHKSNNSKKSSMGVSGIGGKEALYILSKGANGQASTVIIYTRSAGGAYLKAVVPWDKIISELKYTGQVQYFNMSETEITEFNLERKSETGTTIKWQYSSNFHNLLLNQFNIDSFGSYQLLKGRWDVVFGNVEIDIIYNDGKKEKLLHLYNYFNGETADYFMNKIVTHKIEHYVDKLSGDHFVWENKECKTNISGACSKTPTNCITKQWTYIGEYYLDFALRKNRANDYVFDEVKGIWLVDASVVLCEYDEPYFDVDNNKNMICDELCHTQLIRNNQFITYFELNDFNPSTARGNADSMFKRFHTRSRLRYCTLSTQDNQMDIAMGIQENKNQHQNIVPKQLNYLISFLKTEYIKELTNYLCEIAKNIKKQLPKKSSTIVMIEEDDNDEISSLSSSSSLLVEEQQSVIEEQQPVVEEQQPVVEEQQSVIEEQQPVIKEQQSVIEEQQSVIEEQQPVIEEQQPVVEEQQSVIEEQQSVIEEQQSVIEEQQLVIEEQQPIESIKVIDNNERLNKIIQYLIAVQVGEKQMLSESIILDFENKLFI